MFKESDSENSEAEATVVDKEERDEVVCDDAYVDDVDESDEATASCGEDCLVIYLFIVSSILYFI